MNSTVIQLLDSLEEIGPEFEALAVPFLPWLLTKLPDRENESGFFVLALVWAELRAKRVETDADLVCRLISWAVAEENKVRREWRSGVGQWPDRWLLGTTFFVQRFDKWVNLGARLKSEFVGTCDVGLAEKLADISKRLTQDVKTR